MSEIDDIVIFDNNLLNGIDFSDLSDNGINNKDSYNKGDTDDLNQINTNNDEGHVDDKSPEGVVKDQDVNNPIKDGSTQAKADNSSETLYSSLAKALATEDILPGLDWSDKNISNWDDFKTIIQKYVEDNVNSKFDDEQRQLKEAIELGVNSDVVESYQKAKSTLEYLTVDKIEDESDEGVSIRKNLIYQDLINKGFDHDDAIVWMEKSFKSGTDINDAKKAHSSIEKYIDIQYKEKITSLKEQEELLKKEQQEQFENTKKIILEQTEHFGVKLDKQTRTKIFDSMYKPIEKDKSGKPLNKIQKYAQENPVDFNIALGTAFVLTNGFKDFSKIGGIIGKTVQQKAIKDFEEKLKTGDLPLNNDSDQTSNITSIGYDELNINFDE